MEERIQKLLSAAGLCSRREAETWLAAGRVTVNGQRAGVGQKADLDRDDVRVDGRPLPSRGEGTYILLNKPRGYVTTLRDEKGRPTVAELVRDVGVRVFPVGRLDMDSEGLLLLTDDGALMQRLLHPRFQIQKTYRVEVSGFTPRALQTLSAMERLEGEPISRPKVELLRRRGGQATLSVAIHQGKNRQIRRMCAQCGLQVLRLQRVAEHSLVLGNLPPGQWRYLTEAEVEALRQA